MRAELWLLGDITWRGDGNSEARSYRVKSMQVEQLFYNAIYHRQKPLLLPTPPTYLLPRPRRHLRGSDFFSSRFPFLPFLFTNHLAGKEEPDIFQTSRELCNSTWCDLLIGLSNFIVIWAVIDSIISIWYDHIISHWRHMMWSKWYDDIIISIYLIYLNFILILTYYLIYIFIYKTHFMIWSYQWYDDWYDC